MKRPRGLILGVLLIGLAACGGGSGESSPTTPLLNDACDVLGIKIFSGSSCSATASSPVVPIQVELPDGRIGLCSGTLISAEYVLTAGHCFRIEGVPTTTTISVGGESIPVAEFIVHPNYREDVAINAIFNDVAVARLSRPVTVSPVPLLSSPEVIEGDTINIFGWGVDEADVAGVLRSGQMRVSSVTPSHIRAEFGDSGSNACFGDSGGPAIVVSNNQPAVVGLTSTGIARFECGPGDITLFANVQSPSILEFIVSLVPDAVVL